MNLSPENVDLPILADDQSPGGSYENLRKIIRAVVQEVIRLPEFYNQKNVGAIAAVVKDNEDNTSTPFEPKKYEDLLATAVINKVTFEQMSLIDLSGLSAGSGFYRHHQCLLPFRLALDPEHEHESWELLTFLSISFSIQNERPRQRLEWRYHLIRFRPPNYYDLPYWNHAFTSRLIF